MVPPTFSLSTLKTMRSEVHYYNQLLLKYQAYQRKLQRLTEFGKNLHRQQVLKKHLERLRKKLHALYTTLKKRKATRLAVGAFLLSINTAQAQFPTFKEKLRPIQEIGLGNLGLINDELRAPNFTAFGDLDNDGDLDLIVTSYYAGYMNSFYYYKNIGTYDEEGEGAPYFQLENNTVAPQFSYKNVPRLYDLDGDGDLDMLTNNYQGDFYYYENLDIQAGDTTYDGPSFAPGVQNTLGLTKNDIDFNIAFGLADLDGDGDADVLIDGNDDNLYYYENLDIDGTDQTISGAVFAEKVINPFNLTVVPYFLAMDFSDLDGDGDLDLMVASKNEGFAYIENKDIDKNVTLPVASDPTIVDMPYFDTVQSRPFSLFEDMPNLPYASLSFGDLDGDGDSDFLFYQLYNGGPIYFKNLDIHDGIISGGEPDSIDVPYFQRWSFLGLELRQDGFKPALADIDNDGDIDIISGNSSGSFDFYKNLDIDGADVNLDAIYFEKQPSEDIGLSADIGVRSAPTLADLDGDGDLDLLAGEDSGNFTFFENSGSSTAPLFTAGMVNSFGLQDIGDDSTPVLTDLDNDGDLDLLAGNRLGVFTYFENSGNSSTPSFSSGIEAPFDLQDIGRNTTPALADLNNDGDFDLLAGNFSGIFAYFENSGDRTSPSFSTGIENPFVLSNSITFSIAASFADMDGDGDVDLVTGDLYGVIRYFEYVDKDLDNDGILDSQEVTFWDHGQSEYISYSIWGDEDGDGIPNYRDTTDSNPANDKGDGSITNYTDVNIDGIPDIFDTDLDGRPNYIDLDADNDGIPDVIEAQSTFGFLVPALVYGEDDGVDTNFTGGLVPEDTDADHIPDFLDTDSDNDGQGDENETGFVLTTIIKENGLDSALNYTGYDNPTAEKNMASFHNNGHEYAFRNVGVTLISEQGALQQVALLQNPVTTHFEITGLDNESSIKLYSLVGSLLKSLSNYKAGAISVSDLNAGIYFIVINQGTEQKTLKLIKQ